MVNSLQNCYNGRTTSKGKIDKTKRIIKYQDDIRIYEERVRVSMRSIGMYKYRGKRKF